MGTVSRKTVVPARRTSRSLPPAVKRKFRVALQRRMGAQPVLSDFQLSYELRGQTEDGCAVWRCTDRASGTWLEGYFPPFSSRMTFHDYGVAPLVS